MDDNYQVFISYRRNPCLEFARNIHYTLYKFGISSFFDYSSIRNGRFNENIFRAIDTCEYVFVIIMDGALDAMADSPNDWVRIELEYAVDKGKTIIPLVRGDQKREWPARLPEKLEFLRDVQISKVEYDDNYEVTLRKLLNDRTNLLNQEGGYNSVDPLLHKQNIPNRKPHGRDFLPLPKESKAKRQTIPSPKNRSIDSQPAKMPKRRIKLSRAIAIGYNLTHFCMGYLRNELPKDDLKHISAAQPGLLIPFPSVNGLNNDNVIEYLEKCADVMTQISGPRAGAATRFGMYFHLSDIAKREGFGYTAIQAYNTAMIDAGKIAGLPEDYLTTAADADGLDMMDYFQTAKKLADNN